MPRFTMPRVAHCDGGALPDRKSVLASPLEVVTVTGWNNGYSFGGTSSSIGREPRWPVPTWKFGLRKSDDRGSM